MRARSLLGAVTLAASALIAGSCMPAPATTQARTISDLYTVFLVAAALVGGTVFGLITWAILRYRHPAQADEPLPPQTHGNRALEMIWTAIPILIVLTLFGFTFAALEQVDARSPDPGIAVDVQAFQWQWRFTYTGTGVSIVGLIGSPPRLVVPAGRPVHVRLTAFDVNHAFYVPAFLFKRDAIPGRPNTFDFTVMNPGIYDGQCAEFCGVFHDRMLFSVQAMSQADFEAWLAAARAQASSAPGAGSSAATTSPSPS